MSKVHVVVLAGGQGTRFWPLSRANRPKQFLALTHSGESLLQLTAERMREVVPHGQMTVVTNKNLATLTKEHFSGGDMLLEPVGRNTSASIALAAFSLKRRYGDVVMVVVPADQIVQENQALAVVFKEAINLASSQDLLVTIGIQPTSAHTGYGYIKRGEKLGERSFKVERFFEKPNIERAREYCESGQYYWNSGMFVWRVSTILKALELYLPKLYTALSKCEDALGGAKQDQLLQEVFPALESISIDFGVLEHAQNCAVIEGADLGWSDVGSWDAWAEYFEPDSEGNLKHGETVIIDSQNCILKSDKRMLAVLGMENCVVIDSVDALLVCPRDRVQDVRKVVEELKKRGKTDLI